MNMGLEGRKGARFGSVGYGLPRLAGSFRFLQGTWDDGTGRMRGKEHGDQRPGEAGGADTARYAPSKT